MSCEIIRSKGAVFVSWGEPSWDDVDLVIDVLRETCEQNGSPVTYVTRVPVTSPAPSAAVRRHLDETLPSAMRYISTYHVVIEGDGFVSALKRSVLVGFTQLTQRRGTFFIHANVDEVLRTVSKSVQYEINELLNSAAAKGLLAGESASEVRSSRYPAPSSQFPSPLTRFPGALAAIRHLTSRSGEELR
jgi:hypothetical protein